MSHTYFVVQKAQKGRGSKWHQVCRETSVIDATLALKGFIEMRDSERSGPNQRFRLIKRTDEILFEELDQ